VKENQKIISYLNYQKAEKEKSKNIGEVIADRINNVKY